MKTKYYLTDHICRCGFGRLLMLCNPGPTGGGNGVYFCPCCEVTHSSGTMKCMCGVEHYNPKTKEKYLTMCVGNDPVQQKEYLKLGYHPEGILGMVAKVSVWEKRL